MVDAFGNKVDIGDEVIYAMSDGKLRRGKVTKIYKGHFNKDECSAGGTPHILSFRMYKVLDK